MMLQRSRAQLGLSARGRTQHQVSICPCLRRPSPRSHHRMAASSESANSSQGSNRHTGLPLSMFAPYHHLPPDGEVVPAADAACDPNVQQCKTPIYTYESRCSSCSGTGSARRSSAGGRRRASLCTCLMCHGIGYVRHTTARFAPDVASPSADMHTLGRNPTRQQLPQQQPRTAAHSPPHAGQPHGVARQPAAHVQPPASRGPTVQDRSGPEQKSTSVGRQQSPQQQQRQQQQPSSPPPPQQQKPRQLGGSVAL